MLRRADSIMLTLRARGDFTRATASDTVFIAAIELFV